MASFLSVRLLLMQIFLPFKPGKRELEKSLRGGDLQGGFNSNFLKSCFHFKFLIQRNDNLILSKNVKIRFFSCLVKFLPLYKDRKF